MTPPRRLRDERGSCHRAGDHLSHLVRSEEPYVPPATARARVAAALSGGAVPRRRVPAWAVALAVLLVCGAASALIRLGRGAKPTPSIPQPNRTVGEAARRAQAAPPPEPSTAPRVESPHTVHPKRLSRAAEVPSEPPEIAATPPRPSPSEKSDESAVVHEALQRCVWRIGLMRRCAS